MHIRSTPADDWREVIGVLADLRDEGVDPKAPAIVYWPVWQKNFGGGNFIRSVAFIVQTPRAGSSTFRRELEQAVAGVNPNLPVADMKTLQSW